jgi:hypothetical protein
MTVEPEVIDVVDVVFLRDLDGLEVFAVFPGLSSSATDPYMMTCYAHGGQHSGAAPEYCNDCEEVTDPTVYGDLAVELGRIGYSLCIVSKSRMGDADYRTQRIQQIRM